MDDFPVPVFPRNARCSFRLVGERATCLRLTSPSATIQPRSNWSRQERRFRVSRFHRSFAMCLSNEKSFSIDANLLRSKTPRPLCFYLELDVLAKSKKSIPFPLNDKRRAYVLDAQIRPSASAQ